MKITFNKEDLYDILRGHLIETLRLDDHVFEFSNKSYSDPEITVEVTEAEIDTEEEDEDEEADL